jgi:hypothetical protein
MCHSAAGRAVPLMSPSWLRAVYFTAVIERLLCDPITDARDSGLEWPVWVDSSRSRRSAFGQNRSFAGASPNVRLQIRKRTFEPIAAAQNNLFVGYVGFAIWKRKKLAGSDFVA